MKGDCERVCRASTISRRPPCSLKPAALPIIIFMSPTTMRPQSRISSGAFCSAGSSTTRTRRFSTTSSMSTSPRSVRNMCP